MRNSCRKIEHNLVLAFDNLAKEIFGVRVNKDIEFLHRMRVASRRLNNILWAYRYFFDRKTIKKIRRKVKKITRLLARARDLDTQAGFLRKVTSNVKDVKLAAGLKELRGIIANNRIYAHADVLKALRLARSLTANDLPLVCREDDVFRAAYKNINRRLEEFLKLSKAAHRKNSGKALHRMRIGAKHLRYTLENFSFVDQKNIDYFINEARSIQQTLGNMHNYNVWCRNVFLDGKKNSHIKAATAYCIGFCRTHVAISYKEFLKIHHRQCEEKVWDSLKRFVVSLG